MKKIFFALICLLSTPNILAHGMSEADKAKALLSLELLNDRAVGIGDHSTEDFYKNCEEALRLLASAEERIETLDKYFK